MFGS
ncbi:hypothetical protein BpHYR1_037562 [Brachionus plicatilis]|jgi:hypothetical protein